MVAKEIKSLAKQSKESTKKVQNILSDFINATSKVASTTETGSGVVDFSLKLSSEAGETIQLLAESVSEAALSATQIAASAQQQLTGIEQVSSAMDNIKATAQNHNDLSIKLKEIVDRYQV